MHFLALLLGESLEPPRDVQGEGYEDVILTREAYRPPMSEHRAAWLDYLMGREVES